jgi:hypothetical protein
MMSNIIRGIRMTTVNVGSGEGRRSAKSQTLPGIIREDLPKEFTSVLDFSDI